MLFLRHLKSAATITVGFITERLKLLIIFISKTFLMMIFFNNMQQCQNF